MNSRRAAVLIATAALSVACGPRNVESGGSASTSGLLDYTGQVSVVGTGGATVTTIFVDGRGSVGIVGGLEPEVRALSGARLRVQGPPGTGFPGESVEVRSYTVLEVNGQRPYVGVLASTPEGLVLELTVFERDRLPLVSGFSGLSENVGAKVWITGSVNAGRLQVQSYGIILARCPVRSAC